MRKRVHPTLNNYQEKIVISLAHNKGVSPATILKDGVYELIKNMKETEKQSLLDHYDKMTDDERKNPSK